MGIALIIIGNGLGIPVPMVAGAIISGGKGKASDKFAALRKAGVAVVDSPAQLGSGMLEAMK